ncbi:uncharacterized protein LOC128557637 [Mercenaria mercenaria]|uniref:uncharacterized protein LOC128557637 n=1 Tax=Mercenaria mercenaria TaxID=6596 RepID=UPI00234E3E31|nr:uncharacterized protein LOC128557637 [Mercenaria mercenaria]
MEQFCKEIKEKACVDYGNKEIQDIMKAVDILMNRFMDEFKKKFPEIKIERLALCGSMAEKTRIWPLSKGGYLEFDYLAVVKSLPSYGDFIFEHNLDGEIEVKYEVIYSDSTSGEYVNLNRDINLTFANDFHKCITEKCEGNLCHLRLTGNKFGDERLLNGCPFCSVYLTYGNLKCTHSLQERYKRISFLWTNKSKPLRTSYVGNDVNAFVNSYHLNVYDRSDMAATHGDTLPLHWVDENVSEISVLVDFHPVLKLDVEKVIQKTKRGKYLSKNVILFPRTVFCQYKLWRMYLKKLSLKKERSKKYDLAHFIVKLLNISTVMVSPDLHNNLTYFLFPKSIKFEDHKCWRISTCLTELDFLNKTSLEHRNAFSVLKFLMSTLSSFREMVFPDVGNYEVKLALIQHIKHCKSPDIGMHVCVLNVLHDIALCKEGSALMVHPILNLDLYEMLQIKCHKSFEITLSVICLKVLILILAHTGLAYNVTDLFNDMMSIKLFSEAVLMERYSRSNENVSLHGVTGLLHELLAFATRRKKHASNDELQKVYTSLQRPDR